MSDAPAKTILVLDGVSRKDREVVNGFLESGLAKRQVLIVAVSSSDQPRRTQLERLQSDSNGQVRLISCKALQLPTLFDKAGPVWGVFSSQLDSLTTKRHVLELLHAAEDHGVDYFTHVSKDLKGHKSSPKRCSCDKPRKSPPQHCSCDKLQCSCDRPHELSPQNCSYDETHSEMVTESCRRMKSYRFRLELRSKSGCVDKTASAIRGLLGRKVSSYWDIGLLLAKGFEGSGHSDRLPMRLALPKLAYSALDHLGSEAPAGTGVADGDPAPASHYGAGYDQAQPWALGYDQAQPWALGYDEAQPGAFGYYGGPRESYQPGSRNVSDDHHFQSDEYHSGDGRRRHASYGDSAVGIQPDIDYDQTRSPGDLAFDDSTGGIIDDRFVYQEPAAPHDRKSLFSSSKISPMAKTQTCRRGSTR